MKKLYILVALLPAFGYAQSVKLIKDIRPNNNSNPSNTFVFNNKIIFNANDGTNGSELWESNGTEAGTKLVADIQTGGTTSSGNPQNMIEYKGKLYFQANNGNANNGSELFVYDGSSVSLFADIKPGTSSSVPQNFAVAGNTLFFRAQDLNSTNGRLYRTDGENAPVIVDNSIFVGLSTAALGNQVIFPAGEVNNIYQLYITDGLTTSLLKTINSTAAANPTNLITVGNKVYFSAIDNESTRQLWVTDGTANGTVKIKTINPSANSNPTNFTEYKGKVYFTADDGINGTEVWVTDGTDSGTTLLKDINPDGNAGPANFYVFKDILYFSANDGTNGIELWQTDGTAANTKMTLDIFPGVTGSSVSDLVTYNDELYFAASANTTYGKELYKLILPTTLGTLATSAKSSLKIYPNPSNGNIKIASAKDVDYQLYSADGKLLESGKTKSGSAQLKAATGNYILKTVSDNKTESTKIIIRK
ncbi:hypothetical protein D3C87_486560 [compost metagenome]